MIKKTIFVFIRKKTEWYLIVESTNKYQAKDLYVKNQSFYVMKHSICFAGIYLVLISCNSVFSGIVNADDDFYLETKSKLFDNNDRFLVEEDDISAYIQFKNMSDTDNPVVDVTPFYMEDEFPVFYIINYDKGWEVISGDKRYPAILARSGEGSLSEKHLSSSEAWLLTQGERIISLRRQCDYVPVNLSNGDTDSTGLWGFINPTSPPSFIHPIDTTLQDPESGHYVLIDTEYEDVIFEDTGHLIPLNWHQDPPFNYACPIKSIANPTHKKAGCVAVAGAQMLYYLHYLWGVPETSPSQANMLYYGEDASYFSFFMESNSTWDEMYPDTDSLHYAAYLIGKVGVEVEMEYGLEVSYAFMEYLVYNSFIPRSISCEFLEYDVSEMEASICDSIPVIISAKKSQVINTRHVFLVDGYIKHQTKYTKIYEWHYDNPGEHMVPHPTFRRVVEYSTPLLTDVYINWGEELLTDSYYSVDGDWLAGLDNFVYSRKMIVHFEEMSE